MSTQRSITRLTLFLFVLLSASMAQAAPVFLTAYIEMPDFLEDHTGTDTPLADGSIVYLVGRPEQGTSPPPDGGMPSHGGSLIATGTTGDDVLLATIRIGQGVGDDTGRFSVTFEFPADHPYQVDEIGWAYIRFFATDGTPSGDVYWGVSEVVQITDIPFFPGLEFAQFGSGAATNLNTFVVIPEPGTGQMLLLFFAVAFGVHHNFKRKKQIDGKLRILS